MRHPEISFPVVSLIPWPGNPRRHTDPDVAVIVRSIKAYGFTNPIIAQKGTGRVIAGHGRLLAAKKIGLSEVPVVFIDIDDEKATALTIMDNRSAELSEWDFTALKAALVEIDDGMFDVSLTGFEKEDIAKMFDGGSPEEEDDQERPEPKPVKCPKCGHSFVPKRGKS